jgi:anti-anti-sigma factor
MAHPISQKYYSVTLSGEVASIETSKTLGRFLRTCLSEGHNNVAIDWSGVSEISGSLAGFIIVAHDRFKKAGGELILANARPVVADVFRIVGLEEMLIDTNLTKRTDKRALIAEDDAYVREIFEEYLKEAGFTTVSAVNGRDALIDFKLLHKQIDLVVTDVEMPEMDGLAFFKEALAINPTIPFIVATGYTHSSKVSEFNRMRKDIVILRKPFLQSELEEAVTTTLSPSPL